jgi:ABC-type nickel/cobalt efflux system permease component RcnA
MQSTMTHRILLNLLAVFVALACLALPASAQQPGPGKNPFGIGAEGSKSQPAPAANSPGALQRLSNWVGQTQAAAHRELSAAVRRFKTGDPIRAALMLAAISFAYGVLHAAGPGHGKAVITSYVLADGQTMRRGVLLSFLAAAIQALSALILVAILVLVLRSTGMQIRVMEAWLETISWGLVTAVGAWLVYYQLRMSFAPAKIHHHGAHDHLHHDHNHHEHHHHHGAGCEACAHLPAAAELQGDWSWRRAFAIAFAVGIRPCTGAILVLIFAIGQGLWWAGVLSTLAMALGTAITVSALAALAVGSRELAKRIAGTGSSKWADRVQLAAGLGGAGLVLILGALFFVGSLSNIQAL